MGFNYFQILRKASAEQRAFHYTDIFFNKQCLTKKIVPNYVNIKVPATWPAAHKTHDKAQVTRIEEEIKFLYSPTQVSPPVLQTFPLSWICWDMGWGYAMKGILSSNISVILVRCKVKLEYTENF